MIKLQRAPGLSTPDADSPYRLLFERNPLPMYVSAFSSRRMLAVNPSMLRHYGYTEAEFLGLHTGDLMLEPDAEKLAQALESTAREHKIEGLKRRHRKKDGTVIDVEIWADAFDFEGQPARLVLIYDVTDRLRAERELARVSRAQRMLSACNEALVRLDNEEALLHRVCSVAVDIGGYGLAFVGFAQHDEAKSITTAAYAGDQGSFLQHIRPSWDPANERGNGPSGLVIRSGESVVVSDIAVHRAVIGQATRALELGHRGSVSLPLRNRDETFGVLTLLSADVLAVSPEERSLLEGLANDMAFGISNLRAREAQRQAQEQQHRIQNAVVKVAAAVSATGTEFFVQLAINMADALGAQAGFVARLLPGPGLMARTVGAVIHQQVQPAFEVTLAGSACQDIYESSEWRVTEGIGNQFSASPLPARIGADAFVARRLDNSAGEPIGLLVVAFCGGLRDADFVASTVRIFAARAAAEMERQEADTRIHDQASLLDKAQDAIIVHDMDDRMQYWNKSAERLYGWTAAEALGRVASELFAGDAAEFAERKVTLLATGEWHGEVAKHRKDGTQVVIESRWSLVRDDAGSPKSVLVIDTDISERKAADLKIQKLAFYDALTGLPNRQLLWDRLQQAMASAVRLQQGGAVLLIDLDNFKTINDTWGHDRGDLLLKEVAARLRGCLREMDTIARLGGDEFVVLLTALPPSLDDIAKHAQTVADKLLRQLSVPYLLDGVEYQGSSSIGIARFVGQSESANELLKQADIAMYQAKAAGRHTLRFFDAGLQSAVNARAELEVDLRQAFAQREFLLHYQPQVNGAKKVIGVEALVRWLSPSRGLVPPVRFIPLCEETGMIMALGHLVLEMACQVLADWRTQPVFEDLSMAVNVSARQFRHPDFVKQVRSVLDSTGADPHRLKLELTESLLVDDMDAVIEKMMALKAVGVSFSLDDFGTGYSSLSYLKRLPLDQLKIDQSFVRDVLTDANDATIAKTVIALGHSFGLGVIAEGVEMLAQCDFLAAHGCHAYQGYFFSRPLPLDTLETFVRANAAA